MDSFIFTYRNRIDAKGRISVPAPFRAVLAKQGSDGSLFLGPDLAAAATYGARALVAGGSTYLEGISARINELPEFSVQRADLEDTLMGSLMQAQWDSEGRIVLSQALLEHCGLSAPGEAVFLGRGRNFQIWEPNAWAERDAVAKSRLGTQLQSMGQA